MRTNKELNELRRISDWPRRWLEHRYLPWHLALLATALCAPSLWLGWQLDDVIHRSALTRPGLPLFARSPGCAHGPRQRLASLDAREAS